MPPLLLTQRQARGVVAVKTRPERVRDLGSQTQPTTQRNPVTIAVAEGHRRSHPPSKGLIMGLTLTLPYHAGLWQAKAPKRATPESARRAKH